MSVTLSLIRFCVTRKGAKKHSVAFGHNAAWRLSQLETHLLTRINRMHRMALSAEGLAHAQGRIQLRHAAHASQFLPAFASSGAVFQTNGQFEHIPLLVHPLEAYFAVDAATIFCPGKNQNGHYDFANFAAGCEIDRMAKRGGQFIKFFSLSMSIQSPIVQWQIKEKSQCGTRKGITQSPSAR